MSKKIALAMIVKGSDSEAQLLERCLKNVSPFVDGLFITSTHKKGEAPNKAVDKVVKDFKGNISYFEWVNDFSEARNFNFKQVTKDYEYILWCDADDVFRGLENIQDELQSNMDAYGMYYLYDFDEYKECTVAHKKTMIIKNNDCLEWKGKLHEDLIEKRNIKVGFILSIERLHLSNEDRHKESQKRNVEISEQEKDFNPDDPRVWWNLANSYFGDKQYEKAIEVYTRFLAETSSEEEAYLAKVRLGMVHEVVKKIDMAIDFYQQALGMRPDYPDAYLNLGLLHFNTKNYNKAEYYTKMGLTLKPPYHKMVVFNPRDYDYNPMMLLARTYFALKRPDLALVMLKGCKEIYPKNEFLSGLIREVEAESLQQEQVIKELKSLKPNSSKEEIQMFLDGLPIELQSHPGVCMLRNQTFVKEDSTGRDVDYYCGFTVHEWNPLIAKTKGIGGSEEAVINLARQWAKNGYNIRVYCNTPEVVKCEGVEYYPHYFFNIRDKRDVLIYWRSPIMLDHPQNAGKVFVDMHDVLNQEEFTSERLEKIDKVFVKTNAHRILFPNIPDEKIIIIPNGMDFDLFEQDIKKDQYMIVNTSSPDRSLDVLPELFKRVKEQVPQARLKWAYGFDIFNVSHMNDKPKMKWAEDTVKKMEEAGIENMGRLSQKECARLYLEGNILAYPTAFYEIDCITVKKAQACGCIPVATTIGALPESIKFGVMVDAKENKDTWAKPNMFHFGLQDKASQDRWVEEVVKILKTPIKDRKEMKEWTKKFAWDKVALDWLKEF